MDTPKRLLDEMEVVETLESSLKILNENVEEDDIAAVESLSGIVEYCLDVLEKNQ